MNVVPIKEIVNFEKELDTFKNMVCKPTKRRAMFISAPSGRGKTCLLRKMEDYCHNEKILTFRFDEFFRSDESYNNPHYYLAREICEHLQLPQEYFTQALQLFYNNEVNGMARTDIKGDVKDSFIATQSLHTPQCISNEILSMTQSKDRLNQAFIKTLNSARQLIVFFFDMFEKISREMETWILEAFLYPVLKNQLDNIIIITAGRRWPNGINDYDDDYEDKAYFISDLQSLSVEHFIEYSNRLGYKILKNEAHDYWVFCKSGSPILMGMRLKPYIKLQLRKYSDV